MEDLVVEREVTFIETIFITIHISDITYLISFSSLTHLLILSPFKS